MSNEDSSRYIYELDPITWVYNRVSSDLAATGVGIRTVMVNDGFLYFYTDKSITTFEGIRDSKWVEKLEL